MKNLVEGNIIQLIRFIIGDEEYAIDINLTQEIIKIPEITPLPQTPNYIKGIINLRGYIIPVVDMHKRLNIIDKGITNNSRIIVVKVNNKLVGVIVDTVLQVLSILDSNIEETPDIVAGISNKYIKGITKTEGSIIIIINIEKLLSED